MKDQAFLDELLAEFDLLPICRFCGRNKARHQCHKCRREFCGVCGEKGPTAQIISHTPSYETRHGVPSGPPYDGLPGLTEPETTITTVHLAGPECNICFRGEWYVRDLHAAVVNNLCFVVVERLRPKLYELRRLRAREVKLEAMLDRLRATSERSRQARDRAISELIDVRPDTQQAQWLVVQTRAALADMDAFGASLVERLRGWASMPPEEIANIGLALATLADDRRDYLAAIVDAEQAVHATELRIAALERFIEAMASPEDSAEGGSQNASRAVQAELDAVHEQQGSHGFGERFKAMTSGLLQICVNEGYQAEGCKQLRELIERNRIIGPFPAPAQAAVGGEPDAPDHG